MHTTRRNFSKVGEHTGDVAGVQPLVVDDAAQDLAGGPEVAYARVRRDERRWLVDAAQAVARQIRKGLRGEAPCGPEPLEGVIGQVRKRDLKA